MLDREFDVGALAGLRAAVLGYATACGMPWDRAIDVMLAVHELAANAVCHGPGRGRLRISATASTLRCEVSDSGPSSRDGDASDAVGGQAPAFPARYRGRSSRATACTSCKKPPTASALLPDRTGR